MSLFHFCFFFEGEALGGGAFFIFIKPISIFFLCFNIFIGLLIMSCFSLFSALFFSFSFFLFFFFFFL